MFEGCDEKNALTDFCQSAVNYNGTVTGLCRCLRVKMQWQTQSVARG